MNTNRVKKSLLLFNTKVYARAFNLLKFALNPEEEEEGTYVYRDARSAAGNVSRTVRGRQGRRHNFESGGRVQILLRAKRAENFLGCTPHICHSRGTTATKRGIYGEPIG